ncbi:asparagine synthase (glutamine-hydrolyzing) [Gloeomargarita lithophora Alchichica-D10]|uniref:asparagine synthase (glutamine-hydrolyzing) n=1 Tax=Gloeomargarita lithophora Alchichica-D10 TaxID=1188229 RepID=A0A1J0AE27_9CYAN|nr:asparagine synthase (glutamine-hydrolyzing) [Gloeomargarita lithophora]APB34185.1 asparagine synthase (glutamine-hydrolyzing) [Gloeomargarita lithophora Alchichica-D10]
MCGIAGLWLQERGRDLTADVQQMTASLTHRGPDDGGVWVEESDESLGLGLGHRRLAILDLSPQGAQPMVSPTGLVLVFNGEIYNFTALRQELAAQGWQFRGNSDTEVLLAGIEYWGLVACLQQCRGMFALALWHPQEQCLYLARDRMGEKPLYYGWTGAGFVFASELKALRCSPHWSGGINPHALHLLLNYGYIPSPHSIYQNIYKLPAGTWLKISHPQEFNQPQSYWSLPEIITQSKPWNLPPQDTMQLLENTLTQTIGEQMVADVPLGAFLSGGVDSSLIVALMQKQSNQPIKTFTIGFTESAYNEAPWAQQVAHHLGTEHTELITTPELAMAMIPKLPYIYDEPFADNSQIPTFLVAEMTRQSVTVSLSGDGGDELFGGYRQYVYGRRIWRAMACLPLFLRQKIAHLLQKIPPPWVNQLFTTPYYSPADNLARLAAVLSEPHPALVYQHLSHRWLTAPLQADFITNLSKTPPTIFQKLAADCNVPIDELSTFMLADCLMELPDDILVKVDRATMAVGLESRAPYLDQNVVELAWKLPLNYKIHQGKTKWILRQILYQYVPQHLIERPKQGFALPLGEWLRHPPLRDWAEALLDPQRLQQQGYFQPQMIQQKWQEHLQGRFNWQAQLWPVLMFQSWYETQGYGEMG